MVVTGIGESIESARREAYDRVEKIVILNCRYRNEIGVRLMQHDLARMQQLGWLD